jgi:excisionase family DNA binding protein
MEFPKLYTVEDVAAYANVTSRTIRNYLRDGSLRGRKVGGQWRFTQQDINDLFEGIHLKNGTPSPGTQFLSDFASGEVENMTGGLRLCIAADYYCKNVQDAAALDREFMEVHQKTAESDTKTLYFYSYEAREQKARYVFTGTPDTAALYIRQLGQLQERLAKAKNQPPCITDPCQVGNIDYPPAFFDYLYDEFMLKPGDVLADIGSGTGLMSRHFLERGNTVYCIEPNLEMKELADQQLSRHRGYRPLLKTAEETSLRSNSVDYIICGNAYALFDKKAAIPEFNRILKRDGEIILTFYYSDTGKEPDGLDGVEKAFGGNRVVNKIFYHTVTQDFYQYLTGCLSMPGAPKPGGDGYEQFINELKKDFDKKSVSNILTRRFKLHCLIGGAHELA